MLLVLMFAQNQTIYYHNRLVCSTWARSICYLH